MSNYSSSKASASAGGVGFFGLLFIALLVLKLTHVIEYGAPVQVLLKKVLPLAPAVLS